MKKEIYFLILGVCSLIGYVVLTSSSTPDTESQLVFDNFKAKYSIFALPKPSGDIFFCDERVPLENPDIWERYDKEILKNTYWQSNTLLLHKRASKYFPTITPILIEKGIPEDFKYLALIESGLENVTSPAGAKGFWQIMKTTGKEFGLEVNSEIDERYHLEKSTIVACDFLLNAKEKFGSWTLAAAAYNMGRSGLQKQMNRQQCNQYYDLLLNNETSRYVFRILAIKAIIENPNKYGFKFRNEDLYEPIPTYSVKVDSAVSNFADFSHMYGINYKILKIHNPWLRQSYLSNKSGKTYEIKIPIENIYSLTPKVSFKDSLVNE